MRSSVAYIAVVLMVAGCNRKSSEMSTPEYSASLATKFEWQLVTLQGDVISAGDRPLTLRFDGDDRRASGFAGCNRFSATYAIGKDSIRFGPIVATKMACADNLRNLLEQKYLAALAEVTTYQVADSALTLAAAGRTLARFRRR